MFGHKVFVETSVALKVGTPHLPEQDWLAVVRHLSRKFQFVVSPQSFFEVLNRLACGQEKYFLQNLRGLRALSPMEPLNPRFLAMPGHFALRTILDLPPIADTYTPNQLHETMIQILQQAEPTAELRAWLAETSSQIRTGKSSFVHAYKQTLGSAPTKPDRTLWAREYLTQLGIIQPTYAEITKFGAGLDAAFAYHAAVLRQAGNPSYSPANDDSSWLDEQQLFYLCDPSVHMLFLDSDFLTRIPATTQASQLLNARDIAGAASAGA
jgi:hypothetical protein